MSAVDSEPTPREDLAGLLGDLERLEAIFALWDDGPRNQVAAYRRAVDALHREALRRLIRALRADPAALAAMKAAATDEVVYAVLRHHELLKPSLNERVETALGSIRPMLASHGGDVRLIKVAPPVIEVQFIGACDGCSASTLTFTAGVKKAVQEACPEITDVVQVKGMQAGTGVRFVSPFALADEGEWLAACMLSDIPEDGLHATEVGGAPVVLCRRGDAVLCYQDACAHLGLPIRAGQIENGIIRCPHHGFRYDLGSGECLTAPEVQLQAHAVRVIGDRVEVRLTR